MTTAPRDAVSIAPAHGGEPSRALWVLVLLATTLVLGADAGGHARFGQLVPEASCVGVEAAVGLPTRALFAALAVVPFGALGARAAACAALLAGALAAAVYALSLRALARAVPGRRRVLLALGLSPLTALWAWPGLEASTALTPVLLVLGAERALAAWGAPATAPAPRRRARAQLVLVLVLLGCEQAPPVLGASPPAPALAVRPRAFDASTLDELLDALLRELPPRALLVATPALERTLCSAAHERRERPDLLLLPPPWQLDARAALALERRDGALRPLLRAQLLDAAPAWPELQALAARRPLRLEPDPSLPPAAARTLLPAGLWQQLATGDVGKSDLRLAATGADRVLDRLAARLDVPRAEPALLGWLAASLRAQAAHEAAFGDPARAARLEALAARFASALDP